MGRVQYCCASSLDGFIAESDDTLDWLTKYEPAATYADAPDDDAPMPGGYERFYEGVGALVSGSVTYEFVLGELERGGDWPYAGKPCWILTSRDLPIPDGAALCPVPLKRAFMDFVGADKVWEYLGRRHPDGERRRA
jgi:dihydrofolate reductase